MGEKRNIAVTINGKKYQEEVEVRYTLADFMRQQLGLTGTELARAQVGTIRLKLLKIGAVVRRNTRRIRFCLASACPVKDLFTAVAQRLTAG